MPNLAALIWLYSILVNFRNNLESGRHCAFALLGSMISTHDRDQGRRFNLFNVSPDAHCLLSK